VSSLFETESNKVFFTFFEKFSSSRLNNAEISLFIKNIEIFNKQINDFVVVFEDDLILTDNFLEKLNMYLQHLPTTWDVLFTCELSNIHATDINKNQIFYKSNVSRGTGMYILNKHTSKLLSDICSLEIVFNKPIDHWFNWILNIYNLNYYFSEPTLCYQGSEKIPKIFINSITTFGNRYHCINSPMLYFVTFNNFILANQAKKMNIFEHIFNYSEEYSKLNITNNDTNKFMLIRNTINILKNKDILLYCNSDRHLEISKIKNYIKQLTKENDEFFQINNNNSNLEEFIIIRKCNNTINVINKLHDLIK
jgi:GR25 family glycosyltransferase involved in LPS biosynthesis